ncbi:MAG TPA: phage tail protein [Arcobacter sp.]|nr:phage tail protein [Arcobacter sp.]
MIFGGREDPFVSYLFRVEIDGIEVLGFREVSGLSNKTDIYEYQEGGENRFTHKLVGQTTFSNLVLKKGIVLDEYIFEWREEVIQGKIENALRDITIRLLADNQSNGEERSWRFYDVWPCKWETNNFEGTANDIAIETLELALTRGEEVR